jgi:serine/threonine protein kinase/formylglycine-generating enzyme required for sulfatase activity
MAKKKRDSSPGSIPTAGSPENQKAAEGQQARKTPISGGSGYYAEGSQPSAPAPVYKSDYYSGQQSGGVYTPYGDGVSQSSKTAAEGQVSQSSATHAEGAGAPMDKEHSIKALIGRTIDRYKIIKLLGEGGFGAVYKAEHTLMKRDVAFKTLHKELGKDPAVLHRFKKEGQVAARFKHKNCIELYDFGQMDDGTYFMAMEFLPGKDLREVLKKKGALELGECFDIMIQSLAGLQASHEGGVIHRDLKPDNIKLEEREGRTDFVKILDFGIAKIVHKDMPEIALDHQTGKMSAGEAGKIVQEMGNIEGVDPAESGFKTQVGAFFGTPEYGSPEQCAGEEIDARSDIYTMGVILYELLTGSLPFVSKTPQGYLAQHMVAPPRPITEIRPDLKIPAEVEAIIMKALEKRREDRYQNCNEMAQAMIDAAQKCGIPITVEGGGTVVIKTPTWKIALMIGVPITAVVATAIIYVTTMKDPEYEQAKSSYAGYFDAKKYEQAKDFLVGINPELRARKGKWVNEEETKVAEKITERDSRYNTLLAKVKTEFEDVTATARADYDSYIDRVKGALGDEEVQASADWKSKLSAKAADLEQARDKDAGDEFNARKAQIDGYLEGDEFDEATKVCTEYPPKFRSSPVWRDVLAKKDEIAKTRTNTPDEEFKAVAALNDAKKYREEKPRDWPGQIALVEGVIGKYPGKIGDRAKLKVLPEWKADFEATGKNELAEIKSKVAEQIALKTREGLDKCYDLWRSWDPIFLKGAKTAEGDWRDFKRDTIDTEAMRRYTAAVIEGHRLRDGYQPEAGEKLIQPWQSFVNDPGIKETADAEVRSFDHAISLHKDMIAIPASNDVQIGEPDRTLASGPIQKPVAVAAFAIDKAEVTNEQYMLYVRDRYESDPALQGQFRSLEGYVATKCPKWWLDAEHYGKDGATGRPVVPPGLEQHPVRGLTFKQAVEFASWAGKRLPTEIEWEYAARGATYWADPKLGDKGERHDYPWGARGLSTTWTYLCQFAPRAGEPKTRPVRSFETGKSLPFGLYDMAGNVAEWTDSPYLRYEGSKAIDEFAVQKRVVRGGSYMFSNIGNCRASVREGLDQDEIREDVGFRCVKPVTAAGK